VKLRFLLDENVVILAVKQQDDAGREDHTARDLIRAIVAKCHRIVLSFPLWQRSWRKLSGLMQGDYAGSQAMATVRGLMTNREKIEDDYGALPDVPPDCEVPPKDYEIVQTALRFEALLVTTDRELAASVRDCRLRLGIEVLTPSEALALARSNE
jgi:hypothetical protein